VKLTIQADRLQEAVARITTAERQSGDHIALIANSSELVLEAAGDLLALRTRVAANVTDPGKVLVPVPVFVKTVAHLTGTVTIADDTTSVTVADVAGTTELAAVVGAIAPSIPKVSATVSATFNAGELVKLVRPLQRAIDYKNLTSALKGVCFDANDGHLRLVATDARRLAVVSTTLPELGTRPLVPATELVPALRALDPAQPTTVTADQNRIRFSDSNTEAVLGLIQAPFPAWENLVKVHATSTVTVSALALRQSVARVTAVLERNQPLLLTGSPEHGLAVSATTADTGTAEASVTGAVITGGELRMGMNPQYILDALDHHDDDVTLTYQASDKGVLAKVGDTTWLLMPVRI
jgi:DNA polymerase III sliding clamp (beta) subunit (PCNA family)